jgi:hypothetical protein
MRASREIYIRDGWIHRDERYRGVHTMLERGVTTDFDSTSATGRSDRAIMFGMGRRRRRRQVRQDDRADERGRGSRGYEEGGRGSQGL